MPSAVSDSFRRAVDALTPEEMRRRGSYKWTLPGPGGYGAGVAEMDFGAAPAVVDALARLSADEAFGYLPDPMAGALARSCAGFQHRRYGWALDPEQVRHVPDVIRGLEAAITQFSRPGSPVIVPTPAYMPFLAVPGQLGREVIQVRMIDDGTGFFTLDLDAVDAAFRAGGDLFIFCNPFNPLGRVFTVPEMTALTDVVDRHGGRVFADEIHAPLVYEPGRHVPYASTSPTAAAHTLTATSASKAWNLPGLKCAQIIITEPDDRRRWDEIAILTARGTANPGVVANTAAYEAGEPWLAEVLAYLDESRTLLAELLAEELPGVRYRPPDGSYLGWLDCRDLDPRASPGQLILERSRVLVVDGPAFGDGGAGSVRLNFATPQPVLREIVERIAYALTGA
jgi:cysteine-S-conjugate beta-lyase